MRVLGIDHGATTGYAFHNGESYSEISRFKITGSTYEEKLEVMYKNVSSLIGVLKPDVLCVETPVSFLNANTTRLLIGYYATICLVGYHHNIPIQHTNVMSARKSVIGKGRCTKEEVLSYCVDKGHNIKDHNEADAIILVESFLNNNK